MVILFSYECIIITPLVSVTLKLLDRWFISCNEIYNCNIDNKINPHLILPDIASNSIFLAMKNTTFSSPYFFSIFENTSYAGNKCHTRYTEESNNVDIIAMPDIASICTFLSQSIPCIPSLHFYWIYLYFIYNSFLCW